MKEQKLVIGTWSWGIGGARGGDMVFGNKLTEKELVDTFKYAVENGLTYFDTAYAYAMGESERILGELASAYSRDQIQFSTKFTPQMSDDSENPVLSMLDGSLERLKTDFVEMYWIHNTSDIEKWSPYLVDVVKSGKVKKIGVSNHSLKQVKRVEEILKPHGIKLDAVQNHFSLLYQNSIEDGLLDYCKENGIEFYAYMVLEQGALSGKYDSNNLLPADSLRGRTYNPLLPKMEGLLAALREVAARYKATPAQVATAWAIGKGTLPIIGVTKLEQAKDATKVLEINLSQEEVSHLEKVAREAGINTHGGWEGEA